MITQENTRVHGSVHRSRILYHTELYSLCRIIWPLHYCFTSSLRLSCRLSGSFASQVVSLEQRAYGVHVVKSHCVGSVRVAHLGADVCHLLEKT
jgi:hypothetical protein